MDNSEQQEPNESEYVAFATELSRIATVIMQAVQGEPVSATFSAIMLIAMGCVTTAKDPNAQKIMAKFFLAESANAAITAGLTDEEIRQAILGGEEGEQENDGLQRAAAAMQILGGSGAPN